MFEELGQDEYDERQMARRDDDFIVDDEGFGYKDKGGEIWECGETGPAGDAAKKSKKRKLNVSGQILRSKRNLLSTGNSKLVTYHLFCLKSYRRMSRRFMDSCSQ